MGIELNGGAVLVLHLFNLNAPCNKNWIHQHVELIDISQIYGGVAEKILYGENLQHACQ